MLFYASWGEGIMVQMTDMETLNPKRYSEFKKQEIDCHSNNLQTSLDMMKGAPTKERAKMETFNKKLCKEFNKEHGIRWRDPITWKAEWNYNG